MTDPVPIGEPPWAAWTPAEAFAAIGSTAVPWCVTAGWAVDLYVGRHTRAHEDLELAVPRARWRELRDRLDLEFLVAGDGQLWPMRDAAMETFDQTWGRDADGVFKVDIFRDWHDGDVWICKRDERIRRPYRSLIMTNSMGIPFMAPEVVLLFKAKHDQAKDRHDLAVCLPQMESHRVDWLKDALGTVHPGHPWVETLDGGAAPWLLGR
jgi:hypothetical protein